MKVLKITREGADLQYHLPVGEMAANIMDLVLEAQNIQDLQVNREKGVEAIAGMIATALEDNFRNAYEELRKAGHPNVPEDPKFQLVDIQP